MRDFKKLTFLSGSVDFVKKWLCFSKTYHIMKKVKIPFRMQENGNKAGDTGNRIVWHGLVPRKMEKET